MRGSRVGPRLACVAVAVLAVAADPAAAHTSVNEELLQGLNANLLYAAVPITILVEAILLYTVWRFRGNDDPSPTRENRRLEITWTVATAVVLVFVGFASYQVMASEFVAGAGGPPAGDGEPAVSKDLEGATAPPGEDALEVEVVAYRFGWTFHYPDANVTTNGTLVLPTDRTVYLHVVSEDWLHSLHVPELGLKQDAFPGQYNTVRTRLYAPGEYRLYCAEYCGAGHATMLGTVDVRSPDAYEAWVERRRADAGGGATGQTAGDGGSAERTPGD